VSEAGGEAAGGGGRGADTELKTKTPHVNVGKNTKAPCMVSHQHFPHDARNSGFPFPDKLLQRARSEGPGQRAALSC